ncbi:hypothetical protein ACJRO7_016080, partial [Eucalyptus globulus]
MYDMIQEMGREIVRRESPKEPRERSRLWFYNDVLHVLTDGMGTNKVEAIMLKLAPPEVHFSAHAFTNMKRLRIFLARNVSHSGDSIYFPAELRWLEWPNYSPLVVPFNTNHGNLVVLDLSKISIRILGKEFKLFRNLRSVNFSHCKLQSEILDVSSLPNLESLDLQECTNLVKVHQALRCLDKLIYLNFLNCSNLSCFPLKSRSLESPILRGCSKLSRFPDILVPVECLRSLALHEIAIEELPSSVGNLVKTARHLVHIFIDGCSQLSKLLEPVWRSSDYSNLSLPLALRSVIYLNMQRCSLLELSFSQNFHCMSLLTILYLSENICLALSTCINQFTKLQRLPLAEARANIFHPRSKIPKWFVHQSMRGLLRFPVSSKSYCDIAGLAFYSIVDSANLKEASISCEIRLFVDNQETYGCVDCFFSLESDHIWLLY